MELIAGVDEAGRGPVVGPLVVGIVCATKKTIQKWTEEGITDSKKISAKKRDLFYKTIKQDTKEKGAAETIHISATEISTMMQNGISLNVIELNAMGTLLKKYKHKQAIIDCPSINCDAVKQTLAKSTDATLIVEHKADQNHTIAAAASIIAKVERDREIEKIQQKVGVPVGSGYPSDPKTKAYIAEYRNKHGVCRTTWKTMQNLEEKAKQQTLL